MDASTGSSYAEWLLDDNRSSVERFMSAWNTMLEVEGREVAMEHARRVVGGEAAGHWCDCDNEQREAARRFLVEQQAMPTEISS